MNDNRHQSGFSLVEVVFASSIFLGMVLLVSTLALSGTEAQDLSRRIQRMTEMAQQAADGMRLEMFSSVQTFADDAEGNAWLQLLDVSTVPPPIGVRRLPRLDADGPFRRDTVGDTITGNTVLFAYMVWRDHFRCTSGRDYLVDVFRLAHYYLSPRDGGPRPGRRGGLDLVRCVGEPMGDGEAVDHITDPVDRVEVLQHLILATPDIEGKTHAPLEVIWLRGNDPAAVGTLRQIDATDGSLSDTPTGARSGAWRILPSVDRTGGLLGYKRASVAANDDLVAPGISRFAIRDDAAGFPHGFEVQLIGPTAARQLLLHLVLVDMTRKGPPAWSQIQTVINAHDR